MSDQAFTEDDMRQGGDSVLGPAYFAARRAAGALFADVETQPFSDAVDKLTEKIRDELYSYVENFIKSDLESNVSAYIAGMVDSTVRALLTGEEWALVRYPLAKYHDGEKIREAVARHCGESVLALRVAELEAENKRLRESLEWARR